MIDHPLPTSPPELLAPAGDWDALRAAVANGADAVYLGLSNFNARHRAANFTLEELPQVMGFLHGHNVRGYVTFNTLIFSDELTEALAFIRAIAAAGVDAVIVQDLGLAQLIHRVAPSLPIHGSTQMTLTEPRGIAFVKTLGVQRVILARELSVAEIGQIARQAPLPVEVFIHGALCISYSGQCLTSESLGGRSANRGQCAQACRLPYELLVDGHFRDLGDKAYLLSPQDLAAYDLIGELARLGVCSFKIEGRLKSAHYVAATTQTYRAALDAAIGQRPFALSRQQQLDLQQSFSRGFTHGFLDGVNHQALVPARFPKSRGVRVGMVLKRTERGVIVDISDFGSLISEGEKRSPLPNQKSTMLPLKPGDGVVFDEGHPEQDEQGGRVFEVHAQGPGRIEVVFGRGDVNLAALAPGSIVWKTDDPALRRRLEQSYARPGEVAHRRRLRVEVQAIVGRRLKVTLHDGPSSASAEWEKPLEKAQKHPLTVALLREQFGRLGDTPFELGDVALLDAEGRPQDSSEAMAPKSVLNDLRRRAVELLLAQQAAGRPHAMVEEAALDHLRQALPREPAAQPKPAPGLYVLVRTSEQLEAVLDYQPEAGLPRPAMVYCEFEDIRRYPQAVARGRHAGMAVGLATTRIIKPGEEGLLRQIAQSGPDAVLVRNLAGLSYYRENYPAFPLIADYSLNVANELTAGVLAQAGVIRMVPSYDLNWRQMAAMLQRFRAGIFEAVIHQHMPMFHMEHCVFAHTLSEGKDHRDCGRPCDRHALDLRDRVGQAHPLLADVGCRNTVYNGQAQSAAEYVPRMRELGLVNFRIEMLRETRLQAKLLLERYSRVVAGLKEGQKVRRELRVLHQLGVTAGTLDFR